MAGKTSKIAGAKERYLAQSAAIEFVGLVIGLAAAMLADSLALYADLAQESVETFATFLAWIVLRQLRNKKEQFNFGLGKVESLLGLVVAMALVVSVGLIMNEAIDRIETPEPLERIGLGVIMTGLWIFVDAWFWLKGRALDRKNPSPVIEATWKSYRAGAFVCVALTATLLVGKFLEGHAWAMYIDPCVSLVYCLLLVRTIFEIGRSALGDLADCSLEEELQLAICGVLARHFFEFEQLHAVKSRHSGGRVYIELHLEFKPEMRLGDAHETMDRIRTSVEEKIQNSHVTVIPARAGAPSERVLPANALSGGII